MISYSVMKTIEDEPVVWFSVFRQISVWIVFFNIDRDAFYTKKNLMHLASQQILNCLKDGYTYKTEIK